MAKESSKAARAVETAGNEAETIQAHASRKEQEQKKQRESESVYKIDELAANAGRIFGTKPECVRAALNAAGKSESTVSEAAEIVKKFLKKEVK